MEQVKQLTDFIEQLDKKDFNLYFFTLDTKGNPTAGIANIYEHVKVLNELGYKASILHEKNDYKLHSDEEGQGLADWLGESYAALPHISIESQTLNIQSVDFIIIPEIFSNIMDQIKGFPCRKIVLSQSYDYLLELLPIGKRWDSDYGFYDVITTSKKQGEYINRLFPMIRTQVIPVSIPKYFKPSDKPKIPVVAILSRNQGDAAKLAKAFYLQNPIYKWITFKELRGLPREQFAQELSKCCLAIWLDEKSGFGTFPLEAMECETPVIGLIPHMVPEWMESIVDDVATIKNNGVWVSTPNSIPEILAEYLKVWLEDSVPLELVEAMQESAGQYTEEKQREVIKSVYGNLVAHRSAEFQAMIDSLETKPVEQ